MNKQFALKKYSQQDESLSWRYKGKKVRWKPETTLGVTKKLIHKKCSKQHGTFYDAEK